MNKYLLIVVLFLSIVTFSMSSTSKSTTHFNNDVKIKKNNKIENIKLEEYIVGVVASEMPASFNIEALKAQAIAARTYAVYKMNQENKEYDLIADVSNQGYINKQEMKNKWGIEYDKYYSKIKKSVDDTKGLVMKYNNKIIEAYYFAMSNGYTEDVSLVFSEDKEYLVSVKSEYENQNLKNFTMVTNVAKHDFCTKLNIACEKIEINNIERSNTNRVNNITINNKIFKGTEVRKLLNLRSTDFKIEINNESISITTNGYGHGVGMSQYGANGMANAGYNYEEILKYFYKDVNIEAL